MGVTIYGIRNCDRMKRARAWLDAAGVDYAFHDYKKEGLGGDRLAGWMDRVGWEALLNKAGTTFRKLPEDEKSGLDRDRAMRLMLEQPSMIRRPVLETGNGLVVGFNPERYAVEFDS